MKLYVLPYKRGSRAVNNIKKGIGAKTIRLLRSRWKPNKNKIVINWGHTAPPINLGVNILNNPGYVAYAVNKLAALSHLLAKGVSVPDFTHDKNVVMGWLTEKKPHVVFCRTLLRSSGGKGIVIAKTPLDLVAAPLYTKRVKKVDEYRVHVFNNIVIDVVQKRLRNGLANQDNRNTYVRNMENGWIFAHQGVVCPENVKQEALKAVAALGLDFGAVDIGVDKKGVAYVFEVNTAPGLENNQTINAYVDAFNNYKKKEEEKQYAKVPYGNLWR